MLRCQPTPLPSLSCESQKDHSTYRNHPHRRECTLHSWLVSGKGGPIWWQRAGREEISCSVGALHTAPHSRGKMGLTGRNPHGLTGSGIQEWKYLVPNVQSWESGRSTDAASHSSTRATVRCWEQVQAQEGCRSSQGSQ